MDLRHCPNITHLDCSSNPIVDIKLPKHSALSAVAITDSVMDKSEVDKLIRLNKGRYCIQINYDDLITIDLRLEHYFRCSNWDKVRKYIRENERDYYDHQLAECELVFAKLKELSEEVNPNPYEDKGGFLAVHGSYISDDSILNYEECFIVEEEWTTCLATKVRDSCRRESWMGFPSTPPEYYVGSCLVNMIQNRNEIKKYYYTEK